MTKDYHKAAYDKTPVHRCLAASRRLGRFEDIGGAYVVTTVLLRCAAVAESFEFQFCDDTTTSASCDRIADLRPRAPTNFLRML
jgi:hypothetical protein